MLLKQRSILLCWQCYHQQSAGVDELALEDSYQIWQLPADLLP